MSFQDSPLQAAKERLSIPALWAMLNLPGNPGKSCKCPWREDRNESFSIYDEGRKWKDFATGEHGDAADFLAFISGTSPEEGARQLIEMAGVIPVPVVATGGKPKAESKPARPPFRQLESATDEDMQTLSKSRGIFIDAIRQAAVRGHLWFADTQEGRAWVVTDSKRIVAQSRLLSGKPWAGKGKSWTSVKETGGAGWPIGAASIGEQTNVLLVEGGPDFLCAHESPDACPVAMLGAANGIHPDALPLFAGKRIRILAHGDDAGQAACKRWAKQLAEAGAGEVKAVVLRGEKFKDLNDLASLSYGESIKLNPAKLLTFK